MPGSAISAGATAKSVPGHPEEISTIDINSARTAQRVDVNYTVHHVDGHAVQGTMAWARNGAPATPAALPRAGTPPNPVDIQSGAYAASLLTGPELSAIFGSRTEAERWPPVLRDMALTPATCPPPPTITACLTPSMSATQRRRPERSGLSRASVWLTYLAAGKPPSGSARSAPSTSTPLVPRPAVDVTATNTKTAPMAAELSEWRHLAEGIATKIVGALGPAQPAQVSSSPDTEARAHVRQISYLFMVRSRRGPHGGRVLRHDISRQPHWCRQ